MTALRDSLLSRADQEKCSLDQKPIRAEAPCEERADVGRVLPGVIACTMRTADDELAVGLGDTVQFLHQKAGHLCVTDPLQIESQH